MRIPTDIDLINLQYKHLKLQGKGDYPNISFDFLGYTFKPRGAKSKYGKYFTSFLPAIADNAKKRIRKEVRSWRIQLKVDKDLWDISSMFNKKIQGWINYYTH